MTAHDGETLTGAEAVVACLEAEDAHGIFGYPGGQALDLFDALYRSDKLRCTLVRHEQGPHMLRMGMPGQRVCRASWWLPAAPVRRTP